jgi:hypothetical protein
MRARRQVQRFGMPTEAAQAIDGAGIRPRRLAKLAEPAVQMACVRIVVQGRIVLPEDAVRLAADLPSRGLAFYVTTLVGNCDSSIRGAECLAGIPDQLRASLLEQPIETRLRATCG